MEQRTPASSDGASDLGSKRETPLSYGGVRLSFGVETDVGVVRGENEDAFDAVAPGPDDPLAPLGALFVVADGMGGHAAGALASSTAVSALREAFYVPDESPAADRLLMGFAAAHERVLSVASASPGRAGMGCTLVAAAIGSGCTIANVGDSRAYLLRDGGLTQVTADHSLVAAQVRAGLMTHEAARHSPFRSALTQCVGGGAPFEPDIYHLTLLPGDVILLCSDGLHDPLPELRICGILTGSSSPTEAASALVRAAIEAGSRDNVTAVCVFMAGA